MTKVDSDVGLAVLFKLLHITSCHMNIN